MIAHNGRFSFRAQALTRSAPGSWSIVFSYGTFLADPSKPDQPGICCQIMWGDFGKSPARYRFAGIASQTVAAGSLVPHLDFSAARRRDHEIVVGPDQLHPGDTRMFDAVQRQALEQKTIDIYIFGRAEYKTIFSEQLRVTEVCFQLVFDGREQRADGSWKPKVVFRPLGPQNRST